MIEEELSGDVESFFFFFFPNEHVDTWARKTPFQVVGAVQRGGKEGWTHHSSIFAWSMPVGGTVSSFCAGAMFGVFRPKKNRMLQTSQTWSAHNQLELVWWEMDTSQEMRIICGEAGLRG